MWAVRAMNRYRSFIDRAFVLLSVLLIACSADRASGADNPFAGNTIVVTLDSANTLCERGKSCEHFGSSSSNKIYFSTKKEIFEYTGEQVGVPTKLGVPFRITVPMKGEMTVVETTWTIHGNVATQKLVGLIPRTKFITATITKYTIAKGLCRVDITQISPGVKHDAKYSRKECRLLPGHQ
jgi:hypothetical protein